MGKAGVAYWISWGIFWTSIGADVRMNGFILDPITGLIADFIDEWNALSHGLAVNFVAALNKVAMSI